MKRALILLVVVAACWLLRPLETTTVISTNPPATSTVTRSRWTNRPVFERQVYDDSTALWGPLDAAGLPHGTWRGERDGLRTRQEYEHGQAVGPEVEEH